MPQRQIYAVEFGNLIDVYGRDTTSFVKVETIRFSGYTCEPTDENSVVNAALSFLEDTTELNLEGYKIREFYLFNN